ncbi:cytochrome P450 monooxygenase 63 [Heterobasidion irregulare TC 32-1]|uniref:Cytochrome P450 monooxygenase 63 n=1 Tax=Heterobasidion irregulare (strain TC 32-1) TaxID=747525 RepID=W4KKQ3_HETIT|nr:cytochrome P450 monooxygenase 63 [Heterobasidion irregulare TC 32-1]ETW86402.1 cytochrome P450 monooxygenase 63 [Heterobasidion irregulare TC 32-1]
MNLFLDHITPSNLLPASILIALVVIPFSTICVGISLRTKSRRFPLPPGPKTSWFGGVTSLPTSTPWRTYAEWRHVYGDIIYIHAFGNPIIILNSARAAFDLLEKRSATYSSRPVRTMVQEIMGFDWIFSAMPYGSSWRKHRTLFQKHFHAHSSPHYQPIQLKETHALLRNLIYRPDRLEHHIRRSAVAPVMQILYGHDIPEEGDIYVTLADQAMTSFGKAGLFGTYLVDYIPLLKHVPSWFPGASFKKQSRQWRRASRAMIDRPFDMVRQRMESGTAKPCFTTSELDEWVKSGRDPEYARLIKGVAGTSYAAGVDTTVSAILSFFLAMMLHPEIQQRAQQDIDSVVGSDRLPQFSDRNALPYLDFIVAECLRWNPVGPLGVAHYVTEDDVYEGYTIPKGTTVLPNVWSILHDEATYPDPMTFKPERFEDQHKNVALGINPLPEVAFGFGRRMCPGRWLVNDTIWITIASVLAVYTLRKEVNEHGIVIEPDTEYTTGLVSRPKPFKCVIVPRSESALTLVRQTTEEPQF